MPDDSSDSINPLTSAYRESATMPYEELNQLKAAAVAAGGKNLLVRSYIFYILRCLHYDSHCLFVLQATACADEDRVNGTGGPSCCGASVELAHVRFKCLYFKA